MASCPIEHILWDQPEGIVGGKGACVWPHDRLHGYVLREVYGCRQSFHHDGLRRKAAISKSRDIRDDWDKRHILQTHIGESSGHQHIDCDQRW